MIIGDRENFAAIISLLKGDPKFPLKNEIYLKWSQFSSDKKDKEYEENYCNELNLFLYLRDKLFFDAVVIEAIKNKEEKNLIDYFLLNDAINLKKYCTITSINSLTKLELILLLNSMKNTNQEFA